MTFFCIYFDPNYILAYLIMLVIFIVYRKSTNWDDNLIKQKVDKFLYGKKNEYAQMKSKLITKFDIDHNRVLQLKFKQD